MKKLILSFVVAVFLTCLLTASAAATVYYYEEGNEDAPIFQYETKKSTENSNHTLIDTYEGAFPKTDSEGNALTWYVTSTKNVNNNTVKTVKSVKTLDARYFTLSNGIYSYGGTDGKVATQYNVVSVNFPSDMGIEQLNLENFGYRVGNIYAYDYNSTELLFIYLPNTLTTLNERIIQNTKTLVCEIPFDAKFTSISHVAFYHAKNLRSINIPSTVTIIDGKSEKDGAAFLACEQLETVNFGENSQLKTIGSFAFYKCYSLTGLLLPDCVESLGEGAFSNCFALTTSPFSKNAIASYLGPGCFWACEGLKNFIVPAGIKELNKSNNFIGSCQSLEKIEFANNSQLEKIGDSFFYPSGYQQKYTYSKLTELYLPDSLKYVGEQAFLGLPIVESPFSKTSECTYIGHLAFAYCTSLKSINIPKNATFNMMLDKENKEGVFHQCTALENVYFHEDATTEALPKYMFAFCSSLKYIKLPNSVKTVSIRMFDRCTSLETVIFGASVEFMNEGRNVKNEDHNSMFYNCYSLKNVYIPNTVDPTRIESNQCHMFTVSDAVIFGTFQNMAFFYNGTREEAAALQNAFATQVTNCGKNDRITSATLISAAEFDKLFPDRSQAYDKNYIVYGYNTCDAFYSNKHLDSEETIKFDGEIYLSSYVSISGCERCGTTVKTELCQPLLVNKGYSKETNGTYFTYAISFNKKAISEYEALTGEKFCYGVIATKYTGTENGVLLSATGEPLYEKAVIADFTEADISICQIKLTGIESDSFKTQKVYCSAYVIFGDKIKYIGEGITDAAVEICYDDILAKQ